MSAHHLYLHIPFCLRRCAYCDFSTSATSAYDPLMSSYTRSLEHLVSQAGSAQAVAGLRTAYVGGGTPSYLGHEPLSSLVAHVVKECGRPAELSFEANPDSSSSDLFEHLRESGATRVSIGVQSLNAQELAALGRVHDARQALRALGEAKTSGLHVSADLMCAIPLQTTQSWEVSLSGVLLREVGHMSVYPLQLEEGTPLERSVERGELPEPSEDEMADRMLEAADLLSGAGYARYEVASYALPGQECAHNIAYWTGRSYLGVGTAASSMLSADEYERFRIVATQLPKAPADCARVRFTCSSSATEVADTASWEELSFDHEFLSEREAAAEDLMLGFRMTCGPSAEVLARARAVLGEERVAEALEAVRERGLVEVTGGCHRPTEQGWLLGNELFGTMWDLSNG